MFANETISYHLMIWLWLWLFSRVIYNFSVVVVLSISPLCQLLMVFTFNIKITFIIFVIISHLFILHNNLILYTALLIIPIHNRILTLLLKPTQRLPTLLFMNLIPVVHAHHLWSYLTLTTLILVHINLLLTNFLIVSPNS